MYVSFHKRNKSNIIGTLKAYMYSIDGMDEYRARGRERKHLFSCSSCMAGQFPIDKVVEMVVCLSYFSQIRQFLAQGLGEVLVTVPGVLISRIRVGTEVEVTFT